MCSLPHMASIPKHLATQWTWIFYGVFLHLCGRVRYSLFQHLKNAKIWAEIGIKMVSMTGLEWTRCANIDSKLSLLFILSISMNVIYYECNLLLLILTSKLQYLIHKKTGKTWNNLGKPGNLPKKPRKNLDLGPCWPVVTLMCYMGEQHFHRHLKNHRNL